MDILVFQDNAYTSPYLPIFTGVTRIPEVYSTYNPKEYSDNSARWAIDFVDNLLYLNWQDGEKGFGSRTGSHGTILLRT